MDEVTVRLEITTVELELIDALVMAAMARLDASVATGRRDGEEERVWRLMRTRYAAIARGIDELRILPAGRAYA